MGAIVGTTVLVLLKRRRRLVGARAKASQPCNPDLPIHPGVLVFGINEPLVLEAARRGVNALHSIGIRNTAVVFDLEGAQAVESSLVDLQLAVTCLKRDHSYIVLAGARYHVATVLRGVGVAADNRWVFVSPSRRDGIALAATLVSMGTGAVTRNR